MHLLLHSNLATSKGLICFNNFYTFRVLTKGVTLLFVGAFDQTVDLMTLHIAPKIERGAQAMIVLNLGINTTQPLFLNDIKTTKPLCSAIFIFKPEESLGSAKMKCNAFLIELFLSTKTAIRKGIAHGTVYTTKKA